MQKLKNKKVGRKPYIADTKLLKELYVKIANKTITNEERLEDSSVVERPYGIKWKIYIVKMEVKNNEEYWKFKKRTRKKFFR